MALGDLALQLSQPLSYILHLNNTQASVFPEIEENKKNNESFSFLFSINLSQQ